MAVTALQPTRAEFQQSRTDTYTLLAVLLNQSPDSDLLFQLQHLTCSSDTPPALTDAWLRLREASHVYPQHTVAREFQSLFIGLGRGEIVPYASWYLEGLLMAMPLARLRQDLGRLGLRRRNTVREAEDHAGLLCESMALMGRKQDLSKGAYARFFDRHVGSWMPAFFDDLAKAPSAGFYKRVAGLGKCLLLLEEFYISESRRAGEA